MKKIIAISSLVFLWYLPGIASAGINTSSVCNPGTIDVSGPGTCTIYIGGMPTTVSYCTGTETTGPCSQTRIDPNAANQLAAEAQAKLVASGYKDATCSAIRASFPGIDPNTGLSYFMDTECTVSGVTGLMASTLVTSQGMSALGCDLQHAGVQGAVCVGGSTGGGSGTIIINTGGTGTGGSTATQATTTAGISSGDFSGKTEWENIQKNLISAGRSIIDKAFGQFSAATGSTPPNGGGAASNIPSSNGGGTGTSLPGCTLTSDLKLGSSGDQVSILTAILTQEGFLSGSQNTFDDSVTKAVNAFQSKYASSILTPLGLTSPTGYVGQSTRNYIAANWASCPVVTSTVNVGDVNNGPITARYIKIYIDREGWVAVREIEAYDQTGAKISMTGATATASCTWCNYSSVPQGVQPSSAIDGNIATMWNAGETSSSCNWGSSTNGSGTLGCPPTTHRTGWIMVDLGSVKTISKIRYNTTENEGEMDTLYAGLDGVNWAKVATFTATPSQPFSDKQWNTWPIKSTQDLSKPPVVSFTTDKGDNPSIHSGGDGVIMKWNVSNADRVSFAVSGQNPHCFPSGDPDPYRWLKFPYAEDNATGGHGIGTQFNGQYFWRDFWKCEKGNTISINISASQIGGASATKTIKITVDNLLSNFPRAVIDPNNIWQWVDNGTNLTMVSVDPNTVGKKWGYDITAPYQEFIAVPGTNNVPSVFSNPVIQTNVDASVYLSPDGGFRAAYPFPTITSESDSPSIKAVLGAQTSVMSDINIVSTKTQPYSVNVDSSAAAPGIYRIRIYGNKGKVDEGFFDIPVYVVGSIVKNSAATNQTVEHIQP